MATILAGLGNVPQVTTPDQTNLNKDTAGLQHLASQWQNIQANEGPVSQAERTLLANQIGKTAVTGNLGATAAAGNAATATAGQTSLAESKNAGQQGLQAGFQASANKLFQYVQQGQIHHANATNSLATQQIKDGLSLAQDSGKASLQSAYNGAESGATASQIQGNQTQFGNIMTTARAGIGAAAAAAPAAYSAYTASNPTTGVGSQANGQTLQPGQYVDSNGVIQQGSDGSPFTQGAAPPTYSSDPTVY